MLSKLTGFFVAKMCVYTYILMHMIERSETEDDQKKRTETKRTLIGAFVQTHATDLTKNVHKICAFVKYKNKWPAK